MCFVSSAQSISPSLSSIPPKSPYLPHPKLLFLPVHTPGVAVSSFWRGRELLIPRGTRCVRWLLCLGHQEAAVGTSAATSPCERRGSDVPLGSASACESRSVLLRDSRRGRDEKDRRVKQPGFAAVLTPQGMGSSVGEERQGTAAASRANGSLFYLQDKKEYRNQVPKMRCLHLAAQRLIISDVLQGDVWLNYH